MVRKKKPETSAAAAAACPPLRVVDASITALMHSSAYWDAEDPDHEAVKARVTAHYIERFGNGPPDQVGQALRDALHEHEMGRPLPAALVKALGAFSDAMSHKITTEHVIPKLVERAAQAGFPKANTSRKQSAFEKVGTQLSLSPKTVQRAHDKHPVEDDED